MNNIKLIENPNSYELIEKKSKFIAKTFYVESVKEVEGEISKLRKDYYDAKHICFAFCVIENGIKYSKMSDDGEPSGTAGIPILNAINKHSLSNVLIVVIRYFGGILLGKGGLTRAYFNSANNVIEKSKIVQKKMRNKGTV